MIRPAARIAAALLQLAIILAAYLLLARPYQLRWGATEEELRRPMPGDSLAPHPGFSATRAISIRGTPGEIWPWLLQMGYGRAGFYGYDILENLGSPRGIRSADRIVPELQQFKVGDAVPLSAAGGLVFHAIEPGRYLIWTGADGTGEFTWALYPAAGGETRLVSRIRWSHHWTRPIPLAFDLFTEFTDHLAVRKVLAGVKGRVEGQVESMAHANVEFGLYVVVALTFLATSVMGIVRPLTWARWLAGLAAGALWLVAWFAPVPVWPGLVGELLVLGAAAAAFRGRPRHRALPDP